MGELAIVKQMSRQESRSSAGNNQAAEQAGITWLGWQNQADEQAGITRLSWQNQASEQAGITQLSWQP